MDNSIHTLRLVSVPRQEAPEKARRPLSRAFKIVDGAGGYRELGRSWPRSSAAVNWLLLIVPARHVQGLRPARDRNRLGDAGGDQSAPSEVRIGFGAPSLAA